jgi:hypothetical protein
MRCEIAIDDLPPTHFVVIDDSDDFGDEKHICKDCAGWYSDAREVTA